MQGKQTLNKNMNWLDGYIFRNQKDKEVEAVFNIENKTKTKITQILAAELLGCGFFIVLVTSSAPFLSPLQSHLHPPSMAVVHLAH